MEVLLRLSTHCFPEFFEVGPSLACGQFAQQVVHFGDQAVKVGAVAEGATQPLHAHS